MTYKELCSIASDMNKPDMIYHFMSIASHNAIWNSRKGAAFGFSSIAKFARDDLKAYLPTLVPRLYRYQVWGGGGGACGMACVCVCVCVVVALLKAAT